MERIGREAASGEGKMLTVKMVHGSGEEIVFEASQVRKDPSFQGSDHDGYFTICPPDGGDLITYPIRRETPLDGSDDITFYVMNRSGSTVATYRI
jgi:hypothetical protein